MKEIEPGTPIPLADSDDSVQAELDEAVPESCATGAPAGALHYSVWAGDPREPLKRKGIACRRCAMREGCDEHARRFLRGYTLSKEGKDRLPDWRRTRPVRSFATAAADVAAIQLAMVGHLLVLAGLPWWAGALTYVPVLLVIARYLRGLEVLVHEGSHYNWSRMRGRNDRVVNVAAAYPVFQSVEAFRVGHTIHHQQLGSAIDPCRQRYFALGWANLRRTGVVAYTRGMFGNLGRYSASWWKLIGSDRSVAVYAVLWHLVVMVLPLTALLVLWGGRSVAAAAGVAVAAWLAYVGVSFTLVLPPLRYIAEAAKHDYVDGTTTITGTFSNIGPVHWLLHPHGDGYHFLHHVDANIPHHRLRGVHEWLTKNDPEYGANRFRVRVLEEVPLVPLTRTPSRA